MRDVMMSTDEDEEDRWDNSSDTDAGATYASVSGKVESEPESVGVSEPPLVSPRFVTISNTAGSQKPNGKATNKRLRKAA